MALILIIQNTTQLAPTSDYRYEVLVGDGTPARSHSIASGTIESHVREEGWVALVHRLLEQHPTLPRE